MKRKLFFVFCFHFFLITSAEAFRPTIGFWRNQASSGCLGPSPVPGTICSGGAIYIGSLSGNKYMTTPGGCGQIPDAQRVGPSYSTSAYPIDDFTPTCTGGADSLQRSWNGGSSTWYDVPGVPNTVNSNYIEPESGSVYTAYIVAITSAGEGGYHAAARYCDKLSYGGYADWFLPNKSELGIMWTNVGSIPGLLTSGEFYYTSLEYDGSDKAWVRRFSDGMNAITQKNGAYYVRCVRKY